MSLWRMSQGSLMKIPSVHWMPASQISPLVPQSLGRRRPCQEQLRN
jgi:hypothetical protein